jgi:hypothetical protein
MEKERKNKSMSESGARGCGNVLWRIRLFVEFILERTFVLQIKTNGSKIRAEYFKC